MTHTKDKPYFVGLDILRFFAAVAVFIWHLQEGFWLPVAKYTLNGNLGNLAVSFFFVLSGFLLSYLLFFEHQEKNRINVKAFFMRRILRIWPLYFIVIAIAFFIYPSVIKFLTGYEMFERASFWRYCFFIPNYDVAYYAYPTNSALGVMWSLGVEEQFYLFLPFFTLIFIRRNTILPLVFMVLAAFSLWYKYNVISYYDTLSVMYNFMFGMLAAYLAFYNQKLLKFFLSKIVFIGLFLVFVLHCLMLELQNTSYFNNYFQQLIEVMCFIGFILYFSFSKGLKHKIESSGFFSFLADCGKKYTYSLYLLHELAILLSVLIMRSLLKVNNYSMYIVSSAIVVLVLVYLAYRCIERPFLNLKNKFS